MVVARYVVIQKADEEMYSKTVEIKNEEGLHARPAMHFTKCAKAFASVITVEKDGKSVNAKGMMDLLTLAAGKNDVITITADGADEQDAVTALIALIDEAVA